MGIGLRGLWAGVLLALIAVPGVAEVKVYPLQSETRLYSDVKLGKAGRGYFGDFKRDGRYFGAFYYNAEEDSAWGIMDVASVKDAMRIAQAECERVSKVKNRCKLYAAVVPKGFVGDAVAAQGLSASSMKTYTKQYRPKLKPNTYGVFAQNGMGNPGFAWGFEDLAEAKERAMLECEGSATTNLARSPALTRKLAVKSGMNLCKIVEQSGP
ncbi:MAG: hypothetical protein V4586_10050 [Pseudomonadota bacterium]